MNRFTSMLEGMLRIRGLSLEQLSEITGLTADYLLSDDLTDDDKIRLCEVLNLDQKYVLSLPLTFEDSEVRVILRKEPSPEAKLMMIKAIDLAFARNDKDEDYPIF